MRKKWTKEELEQELEHDRIVEREINDVTQPIMIQDVMISIEKVRKSRQKEYPVYTQAYLAKKAGISRATYHNYLKGKYDSIELKTVLNIVHELRCNITDVIKRGDAEE